MRPPGRRLRTGRDRDWRVYKQILRLNVQRQPRLGFVFRQPQSNQLTLLSGLTVYFLLLRLMSLSVSPTTTSRFVYKSYNGSEIDDALMGRCAQLFSNNYGIWGQNAAAMRGLNPGS